MQVQRGWTHAFVRAAIAIAAATALRLVLQPALAGTQVWLTFWPAVFLVAWFGGWRAGLIAIVVGVTVVNGWLVDASYLDAPAALAGSAVFSICGGAFCFASYTAQQQRGRERGLHERYQTFAGALSEAITPADVGRALVNAGTQLLDADVGVCARFTETGRFELVTDHGLGETVDLGDESRQPRGPLTRALQTRELQVAETAREVREMFAGQLPADPALGAAVALPLLLGGRSIGAVAFRFVRERSFSEDERALLATLAAQAAQAFERASLYQREVAAKARMRSLVELAEVLAGTESLEDVGAAVVGEGKRTSGADTAVLYVLREDARVLELTAHEGAPPELVERLSTVNLDTALGGHMLQERWAERGEDYHATVPEIAHIPTSQRRVDAYWSVPLVAEGEVIGVLGMGFHAVRSFPPEERELVGVFARHCAQAISRALRKRSADAAQRAKDEFLAMLGHELRNPLAPITTALELIERKGLADSARALSIIGRQVRHLTRMVDDLLDVSRIRAGKIQLERASVELAEIVAIAMETVGPLIALRKHRVSVDVASAGLLVHVDAGRIAQVLGNILANAAKYTDPGGVIVLHAARVAQTVSITVRDSGIGIDAPLLPRVFDLFTQEPQSTDRSRGGLGLGLAIARTFVELHDGTIAIHSDGKNAGTMVTIQLPLADTPAAVPRVTPLPPELTRDAVRRVLIVDDNKDAADMLADLAALRGHVTCKAHDGETALRLVEEFRPDVALLDIGLPGMDGYALARALRSIPALARTRLVAATGYGAPGDRDRTRAAGFELHLVKPLQLEDVIRAIEGSSMVSPSSSEA